MNRNIGVFFLILLASSLGFSQTVKEASTPLGDTLTRALTKSALSSGDAKPFHIRVSLAESTNPSSEYHAQIEEYWASPQQWRRSVEAPDFKQTIITNGDRVSEQTQGDYYPLWLRNFIVGIFDLVPNPEQWNRAGGNVSQLTLPNGQQTNACVRLKSKVGTEGVNNDAFSTLCFDASSLINFVGSPGYDMEFHDYKSFGKKMMPRRLQNDPEPGTELVAKVLVLEELKSSDPSLFTVDQSTPTDQRLQSIRVSQETIERAAQGQNPLSWPAVQSGKTSGVLSMYISVDRHGQIREAYPLNADNPGLQDAARDQLLKWKLKPLVSHGVPVQAEAALTFHFDTTLADSLGNNNKK